MKKLMLFIIISVLMSTSAMAFACNGLDFTDPEVCSGKGDCGPDGCICYEGWGGLICEYEDIEHIFCDGIWQNDPLVCNGKGICGDDGICACYPDYLGQSCERVAQCNGYDYYDDLACGEHGTCVEDGVCECDPFWYTQDEAEPCGAELKCGIEPYLFAGSYGCNFKGQCLDVGNGEIGECVCDYGYTGESCLEILTCNGVEYFKADVCSGLGECTPDGCECLPGVNGDDCQYDDRKCGMYLYYQDGACNRQGSCEYDSESDQYECECYQGYYSSEIFPHCNGLVTCGNIPWDQPAACGEHGNCVDQDVCECDTYWTGNNCMEQITCNWVFGGDSNVCSGNGICTVDGECVCDAEHWGEDCELSTTCGGQSPYDPLVCDGIGICTSEGCVLYETSCFGVADNDPSVCSGKGYCTGQNICSCFAGYFGEDCSDLADGDSDGYTTDDCDDTDASINPGAQEVCDGVDNDCDGMIDEDFTNLGYSCIVGLGVCTGHGHRVCSENGLTTVCDATPREPSVEICDGLDNDCDDAIDEDLGIYESCTVGVGACERTGFIECDGNGGVYCYAKPGQPTSDDNCNGIDNDCDGMIDEDYASITTSCGIGVCASSGNIICTEGNEVDTCTPLVPSEEVCDGVDNDCDGEVDENCPVCESFDTPGNSIDEDCDGKVSCDSSKKWRTHGSYVWCVTKAAHKLYKAGDITKKERIQLTRDAAKSDVGKKVWKKFFKRWWRK